ncbi:hypothetical protein [Nocardioides marmoraquaticus]
MTKVLLIVHVIAGIVFVGPVTVAVSLFPRYARLTTSPDGLTGALPVLVLLRRISVVYAVLGISVPVFGIGVALRLGVLTDAWLVAAMLLTLVAAALLAVVILPEQGRVLERVRGEDGVGPALARPLVRLGMASGAFSLLWAVVVALMIVRPGSTTSV